jgi:hypothetical protein
MNEDELILKTPENVILEAEFGCSQTVRLWNPKLYDNEGNEIMCVCGKSAEQITVGKESYLAMCNSCRQDYEKGKND